MTTWRCTLLGHAWRYEVTVSQGGKTASRYGCRRSGCDMVTWRD